MNIFISNTSDIPIYQQIMHQMQDAILNGELNEGDMLPSIRALAKDIRVSVITTKRAYDELEEAGYIVSVVGKGSYVAHNNRELIRENQMRIVEEKLLEAYQQAKVIGITKQQMFQMMELLYEEA